MADAASDIIQENLSRMNSSNREEVLEKTRREVIDVLRASVRPEFLNRIDETIVFHPLTMSDVKDILKLQISAVQKLVEDKGMTLTITEYAMEYLCSKGFDPSYGARPVKRLLQRELVNELAKSLLEGKLNREKPIIVDCFDDELVFRN